MNNDEKMNFSLKLIISSFIALFLFVHVAYATEYKNPYYESEEFDIAQQYYFNEKNYEKAFEAYSKGAEKGDADCVYWVGAMHLDGEGTEKDFAKGDQYIRQAAGMGSRTAMANLGRFYLYGFFGYPKDIPEGLKYLDQAISLNGSSACFIKGEAYENGTFGTPNMIKARELYEIAVENGDLGAKEKLAQLDAKASGVSEKSEEQQKGATQRTADELLVEASANRMRFDKTFKGQRIDLSGYVGEIKPDDNEFILQLFGKQGYSAGPFAFIECHFSAAQEDALLDLTKGDLITISAAYQGKEDFEVGAFVLYECEVVK